jgi:hypothetical protein
MERNRTHLSETPLSNSKHVGARIDRVDAETPRDERVRQLPRSAANLENPRASRQATTIDGSIHEPSRITGSGGVIRLCGDIEPLTQGASSLDATHDESVVMGRPVRLSLYNFPVLKS